MTDKRRSCRMSTLVENASNVDKLSEQAAKKNRVQRKKTKIKEHKKHKTNKDIELKNIEPSSPSLLE